MKISVVIPCFRVRDQILAVIESIDEQVQHIYCVDDRCPENTGTYLQDNCADSRLKIITHTENQGVGGAMVTGYKAALADGADIIVKIDGDGQMNPGLIARFVAPIARGDADYCKGNRFYKPEYLADMPRSRIWGNAGLSFFAKLSSGYWQIFDPTNGFTAIDARVLRQIDLEELSRRYFFESDMLFRLGLVRAAVQDIPMQAVYGSEHSGINPAASVLPFFGQHMSRFLRRVVLNYFIRDFNIGSVYLIASLLLIPFGFVFGATNWIASGLTDNPATAGTVMLAALPLYIGINTLFGFFNYDTANAPNSPIHRFLD